MNGRAAYELRNPQHFRRQDGKIVQWMDRDPVLNGGFCYLCEELVTPPVLIMQRDRTDASAVPAIPEISSEDRGEYLFLAIAAYEHERLEPSYLPLCRNFGREDALRFALTARRGGLLCYHDVYLVQLFNEQVAGASIARQREALTAAALGARENAVWYKIRSVHIREWLGPFYEAYGRYRSDSFRPGPGAG